MKLIQNLALSTSPKHHLRVSILLIMMMLLTACVGQTPTASPMETQAETGEAEDNTAISTPTDIALNGPVSLYLDETLPSGLIKVESASNITLSSEEEASLWLGPVSRAPQGEVLFTVTWVYALAAPFPTLTDNVTSPDLEMFWQGSMEDALSSASKLYLPKSLAKILDALWGDHDSSRVETFKDIPDSEILWDENAWAVLPFDSLNTKLKVISVDGLSPLFNDFDPEAYALTVEFVLVMNEDNKVALSESDLRSLTDTIQSTNRDPDKLTTLVMTGVTALVRATAYKMEINGLTYPGEEIVDWLSEADLTHISNEVSFYPDCPYPNPNSRSLLFCSNPDYIELFDFVGADIIELTGNHNNDSLYVYGADVVPFTLNLYQQHGMVYFGGGHDLEEATTAALVTHNGNQLAFIGCNLTGPDHAWATETGGGAAPCGDYQWMTDEISRLSDEGFLVIATFQYTENYSNTAGERQIKDFRLMAEAGAVIVNGSQAHRPKGMAFDQDAFIDYGLGNLFFDQMGVTIGGVMIEQTRWEVIQRHTFYDGQHLSTELLTAMLEDYAQPRPMTEKERLVFLEELFIASGWDPR